MLPFHQSGSVCPFPRALFVNVPQANPEATVGYGSRGVLIIIYQLGYCYLNTRKHRQMITFELNVSLIYHLCLAGWNPAQFHCREETSTKGFAEKSHCVGRRGLHVSLWCRFWPSPLLVLSRTAWLPATVGVKWPQKKESSNTASSYTSILVGSACSLPLVPTIETCH